MPHDVTLIALLAAAFVLAFAFGFVANRVGLPPLVGYLVAGIVIGARASGISADTSMAGQLAEVGVILLMFGVGLHFSLADLLAVRRLAVPGAVAEITIATATGTLTAMLLGWTLGAGLILGLCLSVASTVVLVKGLEERGTMASANGRIAVGWLIVEDLAMVIVLVLLPVVAELLGGTVTESAHGSDANGVAITLALTLVKVAAFGAVALSIGPRIMPWLLRQVARTGSRELFTLAVLALSLGIAFGAAELFGVSFALGAFFAGMVLNESDISHKAAANSLPLQDAFAVLFFVSVGMLFNPAIILGAPLMLAAVAALVLLGKPLLAVGIVIVLGYPASTALTIAASLAQVGEFSFILASLGIGYKLLPPEGLSLVVGASLLAITLNPLAFRLSERLLRFIAARPRMSDALERSRHARLDVLEQELEAARVRAEQKAAEHRSLTPQELVERFPMFSGLTPEQREVVLLYMRPQTANPGERIIRKGDQADAAYFISEGEVEVLVAGKRIRLGPGNFVGEMGLLTGQPRTADVTALDYSAFLKLTRSDFDEIMGRYPDIRAHIAALAATRDQMNREQTEEARAPERATGG